MFIWTFLLRITHTIISQSIADSSWITLYNTAHVYNTQVSEYSWHLSIALLWILEQNNGLLFKHVLGSHASDINRPLMVWSWYEVGRNLLLGWENRQIDVQRDRQTDTVQCREVHFRLDSVRRWTPEVLTARAVSTKLQVAHGLTSIVTVTQMSNKFHIFIEPVDYQPCSEKTPNRPQLEAKYI